MTDLDALLRQDVPLHRHTTLGVGGPARWLAEIDDLPDLARCLAFARREAAEIFVLGGGSNLLVADTGFDGLVLRWTGRSLRFQPEGGQVRVHAGAGLPWDALVAASVQRKLAGIECLSGIPGLVGAAPVQNIGAYGQELSEVLSKVHAVDLRTGEERSFTADDLALGYRHSEFKGPWRDRYLLRGIEILLQPGDAPTLRHGPLRDALQGEIQGVEQVRDAVLQLRASKSMLLSSTGPNRRSAGSFFLNPIVDEQIADEIRRKVTQRGLSSAQLPLWPAGEGRFKLSAAWLMERAGFGKGWGEGPTGLSSEHCLALINRGGATAEDLITVARAVRRGVQDAFGLTLQPEPVFLGFDRPDDELLA